MNLIVDPAFHMWFVMALTIAAVIAFIREDFSLEMISVGILTALLVFGQFFPLEDVNGKNQLDAATLLAGFANPSLIAVLGLLVMGQAMIQTDALQIVTSRFALMDKKMALLAILLIFLFVGTASAFLNNTPLVVIAIPLLQSMAQSVGLSESRVMIPLSFVAILGGMMTLIGSSTNLLVSSSMTSLGYEPIGFFSFIVPGSIMAAVGFVYVVLVAPRILPDRASMAKALTGGGNKKEFVAELDIHENSKLVGLECVQGTFPGLGHIDIKLIQRGGHLILPPFEGYKINPGDNVIISATRENLTKLIAQYPVFLLSEENDARRKAAEVEDDEDEAVRILAEIMITPASRLVDMSLEHINLDRKYGTIVLGIERRAKVVRRRLGRIRLQAGDVLLVAGAQDTIDSLRDSNDFIVLSGSKKDLPIPRKAPLAVTIFLGAVGMAAAGIISIPVAAIAGSVMLIATRCLNVRQAMRAIDRKIFFLVGAMLALGAAMQATGGARFIAETLLNLPFAQTPLGMMGTLFLLIAFTTNILTNNACAILFTPIALSLAGSLELSEPIAYDLSFVFAITVIFGANCSFASPIGYQTNLLVMGPGHYKFRDFLVVGVPLIFIMWGTFLIIGKYYFGL